MFTGIIKELGRVTEISKAGTVSRLAVESEEISKNIKIGDSVSVNGACLTVVEKRQHILYFDVMQETLARTTLKDLNKNDIVNLEDSLKAGDTLSGHLVLGHIDCIGKIGKIDKVGKDVSIQIEIPAEFMTLVTEKGSIAIDGVSLTIGRVKDNIFKVHLIPHTLKATTLGFKKTGDRTNIEFDVIARYVSKSKDAEKRPKITEEFLKEKGFI